MRGKQERLEEEDRRGFRGAERRRERCTRPRLVGEQIRGQQRGP